jgi:hypothetical protein
MAVPTLITDLSTTPASNSPAGSENVFPNLDDYLRAQAAFLASVRDNSGNGWVTPYLPLAGGTMTGSVSGLQMASANGGQLAGLRNKIINGDMRVAQRGTSISIPTSGQYLLDRWIYTFDGTGATRASIQQIFPAGTGPQGLTNFLSYVQSVAGSGATYSILEQRIEGVSAFAGQAVTLSFYARNNASTALPQIICRQSFGASGSPTVSTTVASTIATTSSFSLYTYSFTVPSIVGKTIAGGSDWLGILILLPLNSVFTFDITGVQLEVGPVATPFEQRPIGMELALCQRYFQQIGDETGGTNWYFQGYGAASSFGYLANAQFPVQMRANPTATVVGSGSFTVTNCGQPTIGFITATHYEIRTLIAALGTWTVQVVNFGTRFTFSAEL